MSFSLFSHWQEAETVNLGYDSIGGPNGYSTVYSDGHYADIGRVTQLPGSGTGMGESGIYVSCFFHRNAMSNSRTTSATVVLGIQ